MEEIIIKILDYGLTGGALIVLGYVLIQQMKVLSKLEATVASNTEISRSILRTIEKVSESIEDSKFVDEKVLKAMQECKETHKKK
jgi:hypothetical protein